jgi:hypothetical protein
MDGFRNGSEMVQKRCKGFKVQVVQGSTVQRFKVQRFKVQQFRVQRVAIPTGGGEPIEPLNH